MKFGDGFDTDRPYETCGSDFVRICSCVSPKQRLIAITMRKFCGAKFIRVYFEDGSIMNIPIPSVCLATERMTHEQIDNLNERKQNV